MCRLIILHHLGITPIEQSGDADARDVALRFRKDGRTLAVATIFRGLESLRVELDMEQGRSP